MITLEINLYEFKELSPHVQQEIFDKYQEKLFDIVWEGQLWNKVKAMLIEQNFDIISLGYKVNDYHNSCEFVLNAEISVKKFLKQFKKEPRVIRLLYNMGKVSYKDIAAKLETMHTNIPEKRHVPYITLDFTKVKDVMEDLNKSCPYPWDFEEELHIVLLKYTVDILKKVETFILSEYQNRASKQNMQNYFKEENIHFFKDGQIAEDDMLF